jgi:hypothetical protein
MVFSSPFPANGFQRLLYKYWKSASSTATIPSTKPRLQQIKAAQGGADARYLLTFCYTFC